uniref:Uncharacterized protein n=1 Tax=Saimiri boliviensis boliviensis TaxID=39432 RepID=A0A2K6UE61_SAIBB
MQKQGESGRSMTKEEFAKMKQDLEAEYLAVSPKTVWSHEVFLQQLSSHSVLSKGHSFHVFLEYDQNLSVRRKNAKEIFGGFFKSVVKSADEVLFAGVKGQENNFLINYHNRIKDSCVKADKMTRSHKNVADGRIYTAACLHNLALGKPTVIKKYLLKVAELFEKLRKVEGQVSSDEDLTLTELLLYYILNIEAAKRTDKFKWKRVAAFRKNLIEMSELEIKHARNSVSLLQSCIDLFKNN